MRSGEEERFWGVADMTSVDMMRNGYGIGSVSRLIVSKVGSGDFHVGGVDVLIDSGPASVTSNGAASVGGKGQFSGEDGRWWSGVHTRRDSRERPEEFCHSALDRRWQRSQPPFRELSASVFPFRDNHSKTTSIDGR